MTTVKALHLMVGKKPEDAFIPTKDSLPMLQKLVQGYISLIRLAPGLDMYINDEGKLKDMEFNELATRVACQYTGWPHTIVGPVVICGSNNGGVCNIRPKRRKELEAFFAKS